VYVGSYDLVLSTYQSLGGLDMISSQQGINSTLCLDDTSIPGLHPTKTLYLGISSSHMHSPHVHLVGDAHITPHSHTLVSNDDSLSFLASRAKAKNQHQTQGEKKKGLHSLIKGSVGHRNVHIRGHGYTYRSINSTEHVHLEPQDHHH